MIKVTFQPDNIEVHVPEGTTIAKAALAAGCAVEMTCGGMGTCGKCRVEVSNGVREPDPSELRLLSAEDLTSGTRLACRAQIEAETTVTIPMASRSLVQKILSHGIVRDVHVAPGISKIYLQIPRPSLMDERGEFERLAAALSVYDIDAEIGVHLARDLPERLRSADYRVTAVVAGNELIAVEPGDTVRSNFGIALDLGSTTVAGYLMDLNTGHEVAVASAMNPQAAYGDDLVSRINFAMTEPGGGEILRRAAVDVLNRVIRTLIELHEISAENVYEVTVVGNTCMTHLFLGLDTSTLGLSPYVPTLCRAMTLRADETGLEVNPGAKVRVLPNVAGFVGSDLVGVVLSTLREGDPTGEPGGRGSVRAGILGSDPSTALRAGSASLSPARTEPRPPEPRLAVDVGTNGEMALSFDGQIYACSAAAGPAFEGARIGCGMRGGPGAIDSVRIGETVQITTIDNRRPVGLCGSGLVDAVAEMLDAGIIDETGRMLSPEEADHLPPAVRERLVETDSGVEFILAMEREAAQGEPITLTQQDIRQLQLAKGSIRAAIETLLRTAGTHYEDLKEISLAGTFGNYIRRESAVRIGLIPPIDIERIVPVGNAAGAGAKLALISVRERERASRLAERIEHIELASHPDYQNEFMDKMLFPSPSGKVTAI